MIIKTNCVHRQLITCHKEVREIEISLMNDCFTKLVSYLITIL